MESHNITQACLDIITRNLDWKNENLYLLYDTKSPGAKFVSGGYLQALQILNELGGYGMIQTREFLDPPQPLFQSGFIQPENAFSKNLSRIVSDNNKKEGEQIGLGEILSKPEVVAEEMNEECLSIKNQLFELPKGSIVILVQSTNFRLSAFRIRLELFQRQIHVIEHNHLAYIPDSQFETLANCLAYRSDEYVEMLKNFEKILEASRKSPNQYGKTTIHGRNNSILTFGALEDIRGNTGSYEGIETMGGTFPIGEVFTETISLDEISGSCYIETYPGEDFSIQVCEPFQVDIQAGRVIRNESVFPSDFLALYDRIVQFEGEVRVRELGFGLNPAISKEFPLKDINYHERKRGIHLSLGKKHGIFGKKLPKTDVQRFHVDVFLEIEDVRFCGVSVYKDGAWVFPS